MAEELKTWHQVTAMPLFIEGPSPLGDDEWTFKMSSVFHVEEMLKVLNALEAKAALADEVLMPDDAGRWSDEQAAFCLWCPAETTGWGEILAHDDACPKFKYDALSTEAGI